jgi:polyisoprenoid-binding protein YceI
MLKYFIVALFCLASLPALANQPQEWRINPNKTTIGFVAKQMGAEFQGKFEIFTGTIFFDTKDLKNSTAKIEIETGRVNTASADRDQNLRGVEWFDSSSFPKASFQTTDFKYLEKNNYDVTGNLTIRDITLPITIPMTIEITAIPKSNALIAMAKGSVVLDRSLFKLGGTQWTDPSVIANEVTVNFSLQAETIGQ